MKFVASAMVVFGMLCVAVSAQAAAVSVGSDIVVNGGGEVVTGEGWFNLTDWSVGSGLMASFADATSQAGLRRLTTASNGTDLQADMYQVFYNADGFASDVGSLAFSAYMRHEAGSDADRYSQILITAGYSADGTTLSNLQDTLTITSTQDQSAWEHVVGSIPVLQGATPTNYLKIDLITGTSGSPGGFASNFDSVSLTTVAAPIPEPSTLVLAAMGLIGLLCYAWRKRR